MKSIQTSDEIRKLLNDAFDLLEMKAKEFSTACEKRHAKVIYDLSGNIEQLLTGLNSLEHGCSNELLRDVYIPRMKKVTLLLAQWKRTR